MLGGALILGGDADDLDKDRGDADLNMPGRRAGYGRRRFSVLVADYAV